MYSKNKNGIFLWGTPIYKEISYIHVDRYSKYRAEENPHTDVLGTPKKASPAMFIAAKETHPLTPTRTQTGGEEDDIVTEHWLIGRYNEISFIYASFVVFGHVLSVS